MLDDPKDIRKKMMRATTDSNPAVDFETMGPGIANLIGIYQAFTEMPDDAAKAYFSGMRYGDLKKTVAEAVVGSLEPIQQRYHEIVADSGYVESVLRLSAERVSVIANDTVAKVKKAMGLYV